MARSSSMEPTGSPNLHGLTAPRYHAHCCLHAACIYIQWEWSKDATESAIDKHAPLAATTEQCASRHSLLVNSGADIAVRSRNKV